MMEGPIISSDYCSVLVLTHFQNAKLGLMMKSPSSSYNLSR